MISKLHFISSEKGEITHLKSVQIALDAGCRWIQLRMKQQPDELVLETAFKTKLLCDQYQAKLIINDHPHLAQRVNADGLHLGLSDMSIPDARKIVDQSMVIGGTANTLQDVLERIADGADYIGLGPYRFTLTKQNLSPILGLSGYQNILNSLQPFHSPIPIIAIGGVTGEDIPALINAGIYGVAMSNSIIHADNPKHEVSQIHKILC